MKTAVKIILVTGGNRGIGLELVRHLATLGHTLILSARDEHKGEKAVSQLKQQGLSVEFLPLDVSNEKSIQEAATVFKKNYGHLDVLINNAGILHGNASTLTVSK